MAKVRFPIGDIQGLQPAVDTRGVQKPYTGGPNKVFALDGRNFYFDSKGPKSGFGTRLVADNSLIENPAGVVQSITAGKYTYIFTSKGVYVMAENKKSWIRVLDLETRWPDVPLKDDKKWTSVYLTRGIYFCHPVYGFYKVVKTPTDWYLDPRDQNDIPGLPFQPQAICETNGRMVVLGFKYVAWSGPSNAEDFLPALGGAGQEILSDKVSGDPVTIVGFQQGFIIWTAQGCLTAEFIAGDTVFRFNRATNTQLPVNAFAVEAMPDGSQVICTKQGIFQISNAQEPNQIVPLFSEFIRQRLEHEDGIHVRLTYEMEQDLLFFQMRDWTNHYVHTFVCSITLDKWGTFDERHLGIVKLRTQRGNYGYVDIHGRPHRFIDVFNREKTPHHFVGLDSSITIGFIRPPELLAEVDSLEEMHEITLGGYPTVPSWYDIEVIDLGKLPDFLLTGHLHLHGFAASFNLQTADCENTDQEPNLTLRPQIADNELEDNYDAQNNSTDKWWDVISTPAIDYDTGDVFFYSNKSYAYDDPNYITDKTYLNQIPQDGSAITEWYPGVFNDSESTTHYSIHNNVIFFDRYQPAVWAVHDRNDVAGSVLTRAKAVDSFVFQSTMLPVTSDPTNPSAPDVNLGDNCTIIGFTEDNIIMLHEVLANRDFKLEALDKDTLIRVTQHYIMSGDANINGVIDSGAYFGNMNFCMGPDDKVYHATHKTSGTFANNTKAALFVYDPIAGTYTDITPWSDSVLPHIGDGVTATNFGVKSIFYDRAKDRIVIIFGYQIGPFSAKASRYVWFWGEWNTHTNTWTNGARFPDQDFLDASFAPHAQMGATWISTGIMMLDIAKNVDALAMGAPCMEHLRFLEYIWPGVTDLTDSDSLAAHFADARYCITVRDPSNGYAVLERFFEGDSRYDALNTATGNSGQFILDTMLNSNTMYNMDVTNQLSYTWHLPNKKYVSLYNRIDPFYATAYGPDWNDDNSGFLTYVEP